MELRDQSPAATQAAALRNRLDRGVTLAQAVWLAGWLGRFAVCAVAAFVAVALVNRLLAPAGVAVGRGLLLVAVLAAVAAVWWRRGGRAPTRLDVARAIEAAHADVGERVSRAVAFLDRSAGGVQEPPLTADLRELAIEDAACATAAIRRLPVPGLKRHMPWAVAGSIAGLAWVVAMQMVPRDVVETGPRETLSTASPTAPAAADHTEAAARLAALAAVESRLAENFTRRFAAAPGQMVDSLPDMQRRDLAAVAGVHDESLRAVSRVSMDLAASESPAAQAAREQLKLLIDPLAADVAYAITSNRLAAAASEARQWADTLAAVARLLGREEADATAALQELPLAEVVLVRRAEATLAALEQRPLDGSQNSDARRAADVVSREAAGREPLPDGAERPTETTAAEPEGEATAAPTSEPRFAAGDSQIIRPLDEAATPQARVWSLLPSASRPAARSGGVTDVPPGYQAAVDLYFRLVLESLVGESGGRSAR